MTRVVVAGHVTHDRYGDDLVAGGCAYYGAHTHRALGADVTLVTAVGEDFACEDAFRGIEVRAKRAGRTTLFTNTYPEQGIRVQRIEAMAPEVGTDLLPEAAGELDLLHLAPVLQEVDLAAWKTAARARVVGIGVQGWIKVAGDGETVVQKPWTVTARDLAGIDAACVGEEDLVGQGDLLERICRTVPVVAFTHGKAGAEVIVRGRTTRVGIHPAHEVDPTGAGDVFAAGFLLGLAGGADPVDAGRLGAAAASVVVEGRGGEALARVGEARNRASKVP